MEKPKLTIHNIKCPVCGSRHLNIWGEYRGSRCWSITETYTPDYYSYEVDGEEPLNKTTYIYCYPCGKTMKKRMCVEDLFIEEGDL